MAHPHPTSTRRRWLRRAARAVVVLSAVIMLCLVVLAVSMRLADRRIESTMGTATATVLSVTPLRTGIEFVDATGQTIRPGGGVMYPGLLTVGQEFLVEYDLADPETVRVAGRTAAVGDVSLLLSAGITWVVALPLWWILARLGRRPEAGGKEHDT